MIAKYNGLCKVTGKQIIAGQTRIVKRNGRWQVDTRGQGFEDGQIRNGDTQEMTKARDYAPEGSTCVWAWSESDQDWTGDEIAVHFVSLADDNGEPLGRLYKAESADSAWTLAERLCERFNMAEVLTDLIWE